MAETQSIPQKVSRLQKDWTQGPILKNLLLLSWPMVVMETLFVISQIVDMIWVGHLGSAAVAGVGIANIVVMLINSADFGIIAGVRAMVARNIGAGDVKTARHAAAQSYIVGVIWGALVTIVGVFLSERLVAMFGMESEVVREGFIYLRIMFCGWITMELLIMSLYVLQSSGDTLNPMKLEFTIRCVHIALCPCLVLGLWIFPELGVAGAAISNVVSQTLGAVIGLWFLFSGRSRMRLMLKDFRLNLIMVWRILKIGIPALIMNLQRALGNMVLTWFIAPFGTLPVAAHSLCTRIEMFIYMPSMGLGSGAGVLVGQNLGAKKPERAERGAWLALAIVEAFMMLCVVLLLLFANQIISVFTTDPELVIIGAAFLRIAAVGYMVMALTTVLQNCIAGAGDTLPNMVISLVTMWAIQIPLAYFIPKWTGLGVYGIRWAIVACTVTAAISSLAYFRLGRWKTKRV